MKPFIKSILKADSMQWGLQIKRAVTIITAIIALFILLATIVYEAGYQFGQWLHNLNQQFTHWTVHAPFWQPRQRNPLLLQLKSRLVEQLMLMPLRLELLIEAVKPKLLALLALIDALTFDADTISWLIACNSKHYRASVLSIAKTVAI